MGQEAEEEDIFEVCSKCGILKPLSEFSRDRTHKNGRQSICKNAGTPTIENIGKSTRGGMKEYLKRYYELHQEKAKAHSKGYYEEHKAEITAHRRKHYQAHKAEIAAHKRKYYQERREEIAAYKRKYRRTERGRAILRCSKQRRHALKHLATGTVTPEEFERIVEGQHGKCNICGRRFCKSRPATIDHVIPLSKGGAHDSSNIQALCGSCNSSKQAKILKGYINSWLI